MGEKAWSSFNGRTDCYSQRARTVASIVFDLVAWLLRYNFYFRKTSLTAVVLFSVSVLSAAVAGFIIGTFFMTAPALAKCGGMLGWAGLHAVGGVVGGFIGVVLIGGLITRGIRGTTAKARADRLVVKNRFAEECHSGC